MFSFNKSYNIVKCNQQMSQIMDEANGKIESLPQLPAKHLQLLMDFPGSQPHFGTSGKILKIKRSPIYFLNKTPVLEDTNFETKSVEPRSLSKSWGYPYLSSI